MPRKEFAVDRQTGDVFELVSFRRCPARYRRNYLRGWQDVRADHGYRSDFDTLSKYVQEAYEEGRLDACNVKAARIEVPFWWDHTDKPAAIQAAIWRAVTLIGDGQPPPLMMEEP